MFSLVWSIAGVIDVDGRTKFDAFYRELLAGKNEDHPAPKVIGKIEIPIPENGFVYDFCFEVSRSYSC